MRRWNSTQLGELQQQQQKQQRRPQQQQHHQRQMPSSTSSGFRRMLSLQRSHQAQHSLNSHSRLPLPLPPTSVADLVPLTPIAPMAPPPLPPRGSTQRRNRTKSEFSAIVLDVNRLFHHRRSSSMSSSSSTEIKAGADASDTGGAESDDEEEEEYEEERAENDLEGEETIANGRDTNLTIDAMSTITTDDKLSATVAAEIENSGSAEIAEAEREAAEEVKEAEDAYSEIPMQPKRSSPSAVGRRPQSLQHHRTTMSRAFMETLETLKTPTIPDSDPESPVYTTDCDDRSHYTGHGAISQRLRKHSSMMLHSAGEESIYSCAHPNRRTASPGPPLPSSNQRRISHCSRASGLSGSVAPGPSLGRKVSRASRAVKLDYEFSTSSGKVALQRLGAQSLARLEDLAQIGSTEQGTNYKRSYVSLYKPLHPLFLALKMFGAFHTRQTGGRAAAKFTHSYIYSGLVMLAMWFNVVRYLFVYDWGQEAFGSTLFLKLTHHVIYFQAAVALTVMFRASSSFPRFFKACHEFMSRRHNLTYQYTLRKRAQIAALIGLIVVLVELVVFLIWALQSDSSYFRVFLRPYTHLVPWTNASKGVLGFCYFAFDAFLAAACLFPALLFCTFTWIFEREFRFLAHRLKLACTNDHIFVGDIEKFRLESWKISKLVTKFDDLFNFYVLILFLTDILSICLILYNLIVGSYPGNGIIVEVWFWLVFALIRLFGVTISASRVNQAACSPLNIIQNMNLRDYAVNPAKIGQLMIFLNKLTIGNIGFTAWNLFTLSRTSTMTIAAMIVTYTVLFVKLGASYAADNRLGGAGTTTGDESTTLSIASVADTSSPYY